MFLKDDCLGVEEVPAFLRSIRAAGESRNNQKLFVALLTGVRYEERSKEDLTTQLRGRLSTCKCDGRLCHGLFRSGVYHGG